MQPEFSKFFASLCEVRLTADEDTAVHTAIFAAIGQRSLQREEKEVVRMDLGDFTKEYPLFAFAPVTAQPAIAPWSGSNLFGLLKPFLV